MLLNQFFPLMTPYLLPQSWAHGCEPTKCQGILFSSLSSHCGIYWDESYLIGSWVVDSSRSLPAEALKVRWLLTSSSCYPWTNKNYYECPLGVQASYHSSCTTLELLTSWSWLRPISADTPHSQLSAKGPVLLSVLQILQQAVTTLPWSSSGFSPGWMKDGIQSLFLTNPLLSTLLTPQLSSSFLFDEGSDGRWHPLTSQGLPPNLFSGPASFPFLPA